MNSIGLCLCVCLCYVGVQIDAKALRNETGFYWRSYLRDVPKDAVPGGVDKRGKITYIGHTAYLDGVIVPGQIREAEQKMIFEWGYQEHIARDRVQILCAPHPEQFEWIETDYQKIKTLNNTFLVPGGVEKDYKVYIGRVFKDGELAIGKVLVTDYYDYKGLYTTLNGNYLHVKYEPFQVLSYNASASIKSADDKTLKLQGGPNSARSNLAWSPIFLLIFVRALWASYVM